MLLSASNQRRGVMIKILLVLPITIWVALSSPTTRSISLSENHYYAQPARALIKPTLKHNILSSLSTPTGLHPRANERTRKQDPKIIIRRFIRLAAQTGGLVGQAASSSGGIPPIIEFLTRVAAGLRSGGFTIPKDKVLAIFYGGFRLYVSLRDNNGKALAGITKIAAVTARLVEVVETMEDWARRGYAGLVELTTSLSASSKMATGLTLALALTIWRDRDVGILLDLPAPSVRHLANLVTQSVSG
ncbi:MAG: hypothetical protein L6R36_007829 [Xanthoria steineri]|nr:MAG: hypothetical protein L6R36_007829 [Xanthoria steineri]